MAIDLTHLEPHATEIELKYIAAVMKEGSYRKAEQALGLGNDAVRQRLKRLEARAARLGAAPGHWDAGVPEGYLMGKVTVQRGPEGVERTWERMSPDQEAFRLAIKAAAEAMAEELPRLPPAPRLFTADQINDNLANVYTITDAHVGMLAWHREGGENWDLDIAETTLVRTFETMVAQAPRASLGIVNQLGDFLHSDGLLPVTPTSGHILDQDGRFSKLVKVAIRVLRKIIDFAILKHERVQVVLAEGNHDMASAVWLRHMFTALYENEPRVTVVESELPYYAIEWGKTLLTFHHGHIKKPDQVRGVIAAQYAPEWGRTLYRYCHMGHQHHDYQKEEYGLTVVQHPTLAARDAYAARGGWFAARGANADTYHIDYGFVGRVTVRPEMVQ